MFWSDEKYFLVRQPHNRKNTGTWAKENPRIIKGIKNQAAKKALCFVAIIDGKILKPIWIEKDRTTNKCSVTGPVYKRIMMKVLGQFTPMDLQRYWWMQGNYFLCHFESISSFFKFLPLSFYWILNDKEKPFP